MSEVKVLTIPLEKQMFAAIRRGDLAELKQIYYTLYPNDPGGDEYRKEIAGEEQPANLASSSLLPVGRQLRFAGIRERLEATTDGDWSSVQGHESDDWGVTEAGTDGKSIAQMCWEWDAKFIANAKSDIEFLLRLAELASLPVGESTHQDCHDVVCNSSRRFPRGHKGDSCSCSYRDELGLGESREPLPDHACKYCKTVHVGCCSKACVLKLNPNYPLPSVPTEIENVSGDVPKSSNETRNT